MKPTLITLLFVIILTSCGRNKKHTCSCNLSVTEYGVTSPYATIDTTLKGKKDDVAAECKAREAQYTGSSRYGIYTTFYSAYCEIEK